MSNWLIDRLKTAGPVPFATAMEWMLYDPLHGYYARDAAPSGKHGDYFTASDVSALFGRILAHPLAEMANFLPKPLTLVEVGAGDGTLAADLLATFRDAFPELYPTLTYGGVERSPARRSKLRQTLSPFEGRVQIFESLSAMPPLTAGCLLANELIDAFPVHRVRKAASGWEELYLAVEEDRLATEWRTASSPEIDTYFAELGVEVPAGYVTEVNLAMRPWLRLAAERMEQGFLMLIDYGHRATDYFAPERDGGTLRVFSRHHVGDNILDRPGEQDVTASVDFTTLARQGQRAGFQPLAYCDLGPFLFNAGRRFLEPWIAQQSKSPEWIRQAAALQQLMHPASMGEAFKVLILTKGVAAGPLSGARANRLHRLGLPLEKKEEGVHA